LLYGQETTSAPDEPGVPAWFRFERTCRQWLIDAGWTITHAAATAADAADDGGIDLRAIRDDQDLTTRLVVQCKLWSSPVVVKVVRELIGAMTLLAEDDPVQGAILCGERGFTQDALDAAAQMGIRCETILLTPPGA
jgi:HJR/Mrr/RecB family endonuclease